MRPAENRTGQGPSQRVIVGGDSSGTTTVDVIVPVYNAARDLARCVASVLAHTAQPYRLVLIDDASPDPAIAAAFAELAQRALPHVHLLRNDRNRGFTETANRGMALSSSDVVLLNSDTEVTSGWLDALIRCAASDSTIGTITPFSNNAEICSFPRFCADNPELAEGDAEPIRAALAEAAVPTYPDLPTGVGFCLYIRRRLIAAIGAFDPAFGLGYGEENDFCLRAAHAGWRNVLCDDALVLHLGGRSFEGRKAELGAANLALLLRRYPRYEEWIRAYIEADPVRPIREAAMAQLRASGTLRGVLHVIHGHGGGTEHHARALIGASRSRYRHYLAIAVGDSWQVEEHLDDGAVRTFDLRRDAGEDWPGFIGGICATLRIGLVHLHNISGCRAGLATALAVLGIPYGYTVHDLGFACPTIIFLGTDGNYCHQQTDAAICRACLGAQPQFAHIDIEDWRSRHRALLANAAFLIAPSRWAAAALERYYPEHAVAVIPHAVPDAWARQASSEVVDATPPSAAALALPDDGRATIAVLGAVGPDKGARRLERLVELARRTNAPVRFVLIGYMDVEHGPWQSTDAALTVHGRYDPQQLPGLLAGYRAQLVAFPSAGPETFCFTLSEAWAAGLPVIVPPVGALAERLAGAGAGWQWTEDEWRDESRMLARMIEVLAAENEAALASAATRAAAIPQFEPTAMAEQTLRLYDAQAIPAAPSTAPLESARVRDALGYRPWIPPIVESPMPEPGAEPAPATTTDLGTRMVELALRFGATKPGRLLSRFAPKRLKDAMKSARSQ